MIILIIFKAHYRILLEKAPIFTKLCYNLKKYTKITQFLILYVHIQTKCFHGVEQFKLNNIFESAGPVFPRHTSILHLAISDYSRTFIHIVLFKKSSNIHMISIKSINTTKNRLSYTSSCNMMLNFLLCKNISKDILLSNGNIIILLKKT